MTETRRPHWTTRLTPEEKKAHFVKMARASAARPDNAGRFTPKKPHAGRFTPGDPRAAEAGSKGGKATGPSKARNMKGTQRVKPADGYGRDLQTLRGVDA